MKFLILSLPRSRSAWLARFLAYQNRQVGHDIAPRCGSLSELWQHWASLDGSCETGAVLGWPLILRQFPQTRIALVRRPVAEVAVSLHRFGLEMENDLLLKDQMLNELAKQPGVRSFQFSALEQKAICQELFEFCLSSQFDRAWWEYWKQISIQVDMGERIQETLVNGHRTEQLKQEVAAALACL